MQEAQEGHQNHATYFSPFATSQSISKERDATHGIQMLDILFLMSCNVVIVHDITYAFAVK